MSGDSRKTAGPPCLAWRLDERMANSSGDYRHPGHQHHHRNHRRQYQAKNQHCCSPITHPANGIDMTTTSSPSSTSLSLSPSSSSSLESPSPTISSCSLSSFLYSFKSVIKVLSWLFSSCLLCSSSSSSSSADIFGLNRGKRCCLPGVMMIGVALMLTLPTPVVSIDHHVCDSSKDIPDWRNPEDGGCNSRKIGDTIENLKYLENCTVIEGNLHISLIDYAPQEEYDRYSFPKLREITGYLMLYRVFGLRTLRRMFPNLSVIRGQELFYDYALAVMEMRDLEELGLGSLTSILNGAVRLSKNYKLCYVSAIDWSRLTRVNDSDHYIMDNRDERMCPNPCHKNCVSSKYDDVTRLRCWGPKARDCQRNLDCHCSGKQPCAPDGSCCHVYCVGGCTGPMKSDCFACKNVIYGTECRPKCPTATYMNANRRCLTDKQCLSLNKATPQSQNMGIQVQPKLLVGSMGQPSLCVEKCPQGYMEDSRTIPQCVRCQGFCPKVCNSTKIHNLKDSEQLRGCSKIDGYLEIQIRGGQQIDTEMTRNLGAIREVTNYIKVMSSYALSTLHFFKGLEVIGGEKLVHKYYSLVVMDNTNLQEIFPKSQIPKMSIKRGRVSFHHNRKLCYYKIANFTKAMHIKPFINDQGINVDTNNETNGDLTPCQEIRLHLQVVNILSDNVLITWTKYATQDPRHLRNYKIYYKAIATNEVIDDIFKGRDACSDTEWMQKDHEPLNVPGHGHEIYFISGLSPYTRYAVYVQAFTLSTARKSAISPVVYVTTKPDIPSEPVDLKVVSQNPRELLVTWNPPKSPNGIVTHYKVFYTLQNFNMSVYEQRDYCPTTGGGAIVDIKELERRKKAKLLAEKKKKEEAVRKRDNDCCVCPETPEEIESKERIQNMNIFFENSLQSRVFQKRWGKECAGNLQVDINGTYPLNIPDFSEGLYSYGPNTNLSSMEGGSAEESDEMEAAGADTKKENSSTQVVVPEFSRTQEVIVYKDNKIVLNNLEHFSTYKIMIVACHAKEEREKKLCGDNSTSAVTTAQTKAYAPLDNINASLVKVYNHPTKPDDMVVKWPAPPKSNGPILKYTLKYKRVGAQAQVEEVVCISRQQHNRTGGYVIHGLSHGNFSIQINANSLAGNGSYTPEIYFYIAAQDGAEADSTSDLAIVVSCIIVAIIAIAVGVFLYLKTKIFKDPALLMVSPNPNYLDTDAYDIDEWEVDRAKIRLLHEVGKGSFGLVYEGCMEDPETLEQKTVAVKTVNDSADFHERLRILKEATTMKVFECHHVVKLLGVVSQGQPALVIMEYMAMGDLRGYLRKCRLEEEEFPDFHPPTANQIRQMAGEIADGMAYLANKRIVHRDLAARNCLVAEDFTVKIADFGMARDVYFSEYYRREHRALLPIRWMAPESLEMGVFTTMSDVWSYGVVLWEMVSLAEQPYQGLSNEEVLRWVTSGQKMPMPTGCPQDLCTMMEKCWEFNPKNRPTFKFLIEKVLRHLNPRFKEVSFFSQSLMLSDSESEEDEEGEGQGMAKSKDGNGGGALHDGNREEDGNEEEEEDEFDDNEDNDIAVEEDNEDGKIGETWLRGVSDGGSSGFFANSSGDEDPSPSQGNNTPTSSALASSLTPPSRRGGFPLSRSPRQTHHFHPLRSQQPGSRQAEHSPLLLEQGGVQHPYLYPPSSLDQNNMGSYPSSHNGEDDDDDDEEDEDNDGINDDKDLFIDDTDDEYESFHPCHSAADSRMSEHSKLLPPQLEGLPRSNIPNLMPMPQSTNSSGQPAEKDNYSVMVSPPHRAPTSSSPLRTDPFTNSHYNRDVYPLQNLSSHSKNDPGRQTSPSQPPPSYRDVYPLQNLSPHYKNDPGRQISPPSQQPPSSSKPSTSSRQRSSFSPTPVACPSSPLSSPSSSSSPPPPPALNPAHNHVLPPPSDRFRNPTKHNSSLSNLRNHKNNVLDKSPGSSEGDPESSMITGSGGVGGGVTGSCRSGEDDFGGSGNGSKDSSSSNSSRQFNPATANGHGPFSHQQAALC